MIVVTDPAASMDFSDEAKAAMQVLCKAMKLSWYIYDADFRDIGELQEADTGAELAEYVGFLPFSFLCNVIR